jgi:penicillin-binding protein 1A
MNIRFSKMRTLLTLIGGGLIAAAIMVSGIYFIVIPKLPSIELLKDVQFQVPLRVYSRDEKLIAEFGEKKRIPLNIDDVPDLLVNAVLAAEDDRFFEHPGVDFKGIIRAVFYLLRTGEKGQGGSTITMQVARNFFLSREKTYLRKLNEILLALKIERELTKKEILELYLNKIYLGNRAYGFAAAAQVYYGVSVDQLTPAQAAMVAGLPKAPSTYNPIVNPERALLRRKYVLGRMYSLGKLDYDQYHAALEEPDNAKLHSLVEEVSAPYVAEMVRAEMVSRYGQDAYTKGFKVYTSINSRLQTAANDALRKALVEYDRRHGYRGAEAHVDLQADSVEQDWRNILSDYSTSNELYPALVIEIGEQSAVVYQRDYGRIELDWKAMSWARSWRGDGKNPGAKPKLTSDILKVGDIVRIGRVTSDKWQLLEKPDVEGALVSLSPHDGAMLALVGGFDFSASNFNRVTQAERQPGSNFKPFNYSAALEKGFTAATLVNDAPVVFEDSGLESTWRPENYSGKVFGPTRLREALIHSRNLVSIRVLRAIGIPYAIDYASRFGFNVNKLPHDLSLALGSATITPLQLITGYAVFANGGYRVEPYFIDRIEDSDAVVVYRANPAIVCPDCDDQPAQDNKPAGLVEAGMNGTAETDATQTNAAQKETAQANAAVMVPPDGAVNGTDQANANADPNANNALAAQPVRYAKRVLDAQNVYIMTSILRDVIRRGTGRRARVLGRSDLAGKTGTTNDQRDAWFSGFNPEVVTTAWVGFDTPKTLGAYETGGRAALPMWISYMREALKGVPEKSIEQPPGLVTVRIDPETGLLVGANWPHARFEIFRAEHVPQRMAEDAPSADPTQGSAESPEEVPEQLF